MLVLLSQSATPTRHILSLSDVTDQPRASSGCSAVDAVRAGEYRGCVSSAVKFHEHLELLKIISVVCALPMLIGIENGGLACKKKKMCSLSCIRVSSHANALRKSCPSSAAWSRLNIFSVLLCRSAFLPSLSRTNLTVLE